MRFVFDTPEAPELNREWIEGLAASANSSGGISLVPEDDTGALTIPVAVSPEA